MIELGEFITTINGRKKKMRKFLLLGTSFAIAAGMSGCVTTSHLVTLPANDAVTHALAELYKQPNYRVHSTTQFTELSFPDSFNRAIPTSLNATADEKLFDAKQFSDWFKIFSQRNEFSVDAVADMQHQRIEVIPAMTYKAVNSGAYIRVPMMFDLANSKGYVDLSALSPFVVNMESEGKYSQFSIEPITKRIDFKKLYLWSQDIALDSSRKFDPRMFRDLPLDATDIAQGGDRKIELTSSYEDAMSINRTVFNAHRTEFLDAIKQKPALTKGESTAEKGSTDASVDGFISLVSALGSTYGLPDSAPYPFNINGTFHKVYLLDKSGHLLQSRTDSVLEMDAKSKSKFKMGFNTLTSYSDFGSAQIHFVPSASNTVLLTESTKGTIVDMIKAAADKHKNASDAALNAQPIDKSKTSLKHN